MPTVTPTPPSSTTTPAPASGGVTPVEASVSNTPDKLQQLARQIQVSGLIAQPPDGSEITISTVLGNLTILLPQLAKDQQDKLLQQLLALFQNQKPLTVLVQPGDPPTQAFLLLPPAAPASQTATAQANILTQAATQPPPPLVPGTLLPSVVLPPNTAISPNTIQPQPLPQATPTFPAFTAAPTDEHIAVLTDMSLLEELANKVQALADEVIPQLQARIFGDPSPVTPQVPSAPVAASTPSAPTQPGLRVEPVLSQPISITLQPVAAPLPPQSALTAALQETAAPPLSALLQPGSEVNLLVNAVAPPGAPPLPVPSLPNQILATVTGSGPGGQLLVQAGDATLYVKASVNAPVGSTLLVTVEPGTAPVPIPLPLPDAGNFGALQQALTALAQADPQLAQQVMQNVVPQPTEALGGALLFFLSAFKQGDLRGWLGNNAVDILSKAGKMELIARLTQQLNEGGTTVNDPVVGAWRSYTVPLHTNNQFQTLHLYVHGDGGGEKGETSGKPGPNTVRFLIDVRLSKLGAMQLDGFVRPKQLDMIVRSEQGLPEWLHRDLRQSYIKALEAVGYTGAINFQLGRQGWLSFRKPGAGSVEV